MIKVGNVFVGLFIVLSIKFVNGINNKIKIINGIVLNKLIMKEMIE